MSKITYEFSELDPYEGFELFAYGEAEVFYSRQSAEPDLGINRAYWEYEIGKVWLNSNKLEETMEIKPDNPLYEAIVLRLTSEDYDQWVQSAIDKHMQD